ncbi:hypothetical protein BC835DRAFT_1412679 [Cytidiella melzeri]|nr:hypothetical protein BC835DRAFT_1412679 [Cytidiella melzeri]
MRIIHKSRRMVPLVAPVAELVNKIGDTPNEELPQVLSEIDAWKWPRSDLNAWIRVLNKLDAILEDIICDYAVDKLQTTPFSPFHKQLLSEILRFERLLLENSTNRKTYNSYDRLNALMTTSDLDILIHALNLLLRPAQQYSAQPAVSHALGLNTSRLSSLVKRWPNLHDFDLPLTALCSQSGKPQVESLPNEAREVVFTFYRKDGPQVHKEQEKAKGLDEEVFDAPPPQTQGKGSVDASQVTGPVSVHIDAATLETMDTMQIWAETIETFRIPDDEKYELLCRIRSAQALTRSHEADREKLVMVRLLSTALFCHTHAEQVAFNNLFLYEPDLVIHIAELLQLDRGVDVQVQTAAVYALDAIGRYRNKIQDVLTAVNAGVNHGILMALLRKTIGELAQEDLNTPQAFVESLLSFVTYIAAHAAGGNMVVGAGLVPLLVQVIDVRLPNRLYALSKTMQLLDNVLYGYTNAFQLFCNARGVDVLVGRIEYEVDLGLEEHGGEKPASKIPVPHGKVSVNRGAALKHILRSMHRMMQSSGTSEGLRGLLDSSLLKSTKKIMANRTVFGPNCLAIAINIMGTFVHNEPTCLGVIQEAGLPEVFYSVIEAGLEPVIEVIQAVPNALGALCLNQTGQDQLTARPNIIPALFAIFTSEKHQRVLQEKENSVMIGTAVEELIRHHPALKDAVLESIKLTMGKIEELGNAFVIPDEHKDWYIMQATDAAHSASALAPSADADIEMAVGSSSEAIASPTAGDATEGSQASEDSLKYHDNLVVSYLDAFNKFLEGYFQHVPHCRDFVANTDGLQRIARLTAMPCIPYDFPNSVASDSLVQVVRTMVEAATSETLTFVINMVTDSLEETKDLRDEGSGESKFFELANASAADQPTANEKFRKLVTLQVRVMLLSDILATAGYAQGRATITLLQALCGRSANNVLLSLGSLHRSCIWENTVLKNDESSDASEGARSLQADLASADHTDGVSTIVASSSEANGTQGAESSSSPTPKPESRSKDKLPKECNIKALKHVASQFPHALAPFFQSVARLFQTRRNTEQAQKQKISEASAVLAEVLIRHLQPRATEDKRSLYAYYTMMLGLCNVLLIEERSQSKVVNTVLMLSFFRKSGLEAICALCRTFVETIKEVSAIHLEARSENSAQLLIPAHGGLKVALHLLLPIITVKCTLDSPQTATLSTPSKKPTDVDYFEPHSFVVRMRLAVVSLVKELWEAPWLLSAPLSVSKSTIQIVLELLITDQEEAKDPVPDAAATIGATRTIGADENRITQLMDMGFARAAAERALVRTHNNVNAATEFLLSQPLALPLADPPAPQEEEPAEEAPAEEAPANPLEPAEGAVPDPEASSSDTTSAPAPEPVEIKSPEEWLNELKLARESLKVDLAVRALALVDEHPSLVFDAQRVFVGSSTPHRDQGVRLLIEDIKKFSTAAYDLQEQPMAVRCRLLALVLNDPTSPLASLSESESKSLMEVLMAVLLSNPMDSGQLVIPKWLASHLLVTEALLTLGEEPRSITLPKEDEPIPEKQLFTGPPHSEARSRVCDFCLRLISMPSLPQDELLAALRLFVLLTRNHIVAVEFVKKDGVTLLFKLLKTSSSSSETNATHPYIAAILRHVVEDSETRQRIMRQEIKAFFTHPRNRGADIGSFTRSCSALALRDPVTFIQTAGELCQLSTPYSHIKTISLKTSQKEPEGTAVAEDNNVDMQVDQTISIHSGVPSDPLDTLIHFLIGELIKAVKGDPQDAAIMPLLATTPAEGTGTSLAGTTSNPAGPSSKPSSTHAYPCFIMQCLTELLFSYDSCKVAFLSYSPKKRLHTPAKESGMKHRTAALQFLITELMSFGTINPSPPPEAKQQIMLCNWAMSVVVALCVDVAPTEIKDVPAERASVRRFVLEAINRAMKDPPTSATGEAHYSRLLALADLCYRLLTVRCNAGLRKANDESPTHISKVMLEKNFVVTLTNALAEVDPNFPNIRGVVTGILRPLEYLTKVAIRMSRVSDKNKDSALQEPEDIDSNNSEDEDDLEDAEREETPDLYRNSSLGMYGGEMEDVNFDPNDEMDEDGDEEEADAEMDYDNESQDSSNTDEEDVVEMEEDLENETGESEEGWHDEDEEEDLVQNDDDHEDEGEEREEDEDEDDGGEGDVLWQEVAVAPGVVDDHGEEMDGEDGDEIPVIHAEEEGDMSEADEYQDDLDVFVPDEIPPPATADLLALGSGFANVFGGAPDGITRDVPQMFWQGPPRSARRRGNADDEINIFARTRNGPATAPEGAVHPLLHDPASAAAGNGSQSRSTRRLPRSIMAGFPQDLLQSIEHVIGEGAVQLFQHIFTGRGGVPGAETFRIDVPPGGFIPQLTRNVRPGISAHIRVDRGPRSGDVRSDMRGFEPLLTLDRWTEEAKTLHGRFEQSRASKLANHLALELLPAAIKTYKQAQEDERRDAEKRREAQSKAEEEEAKRLREEREQQEREEAEKIRVEQDRAAAEAETVVGPPPAERIADTDTEMADVTAESARDGETVSPNEEQPASDAGPSNVTERITVTIHGNPVDITDTGIDPTFLEALPDDMREEVLNQHIRDQRAARVERPTDSQISPEFLDALPPELRAEIIQQENLERARRGTERNPAAPVNVPAVPADMDAADFIASLDPQLRQVVLMDSEDVFIQNLPPHMLAEAGIYRDMQHDGRARNQADAAATRRSQPQATPTTVKPTLSRDAIQLLDKQAIAVLIRLLFFPQVLRKNILSKVLVNLSENSRTRTDIFNLLLSILHDGTGDLSSIDKSFSQMSFRNSKPSSIQATPRSAGKTPLSQIEVVPELVAQRCLDALAFVTGHNEVSSVFFLTEQELPASLRRTTSKKGKGKEKQIAQTYYPIVLLLGQLDRQALLRTPTLMEAIVGLLALVTKPLAGLKDSKAKDTIAQPSTSTQDTGASAGQSTDASATAPVQPPIAADIPPVQPPLAVVSAADSSEATAPHQQASSQPSSQEKVVVSQPPAIPAPVLRLVVNILTAGECSGRAFSHTLSLIQHLSFIPGARDVIAQELCSRAQESGQHLFNALDDLAAALHDSRDDDVTIAIASKFSPASSDQAKLLRVLKTIDYMCSPKSTVSSTETPDKDVEKVQSIYEGFRFTALWRRLGDCLAIIEEKQELEHVATVLLPLIESLMVVCKYVGPRTSSNAVARSLRASASPKTPTTTRESMEDLFVTFTDAHRKVLNLMVRNNPSLMSGSFSLLVNNARVLDFDNKRNYFNQQLHRRPATREHYSTLQLNVRRNRVFEDSYQYLQRKTGEQIKYGKLSVRFYHEEGVDAGGVTREWFQILARQMFNPDYCLFQPCAADKLTYQPNKASSINPEHLSFFKFVGRIIGKAIYDGRLLDAYFARSLYRQILGKPVDYRDVEWVDPEYYKSLCWILENDPSLLELTFSVEADEFGVTKLVELKENGATSPVTQENKREFVQLSAQWRLYSSIKDQIEALLGGFYEIIPKELITIFDEKELELLISGTPDIDVDEWRAATEYNGYTSSDPAIVWFWRALKSFNREERAKVLSFATGTSRVPLGGFVDLQGVQGTQRFSIHRAYGEVDRLPQAHTCFNQIDLPQYSSYEMLRQQVLLAIHEGGEGFGFA